MMSHCLLLYYSIGLPDPIKEGPKLDLYLFYLQFRQFLAVALLPVRVLPPSVLIGHHLLAPEVGYDIADHLRVLEERLAELDFLTVMDHEHIFYRNFFVFFGMR